MKDIPLLVTMLSQGWLTVFVFSFFFHPRFLPHPLWTESRIGFILSFAGLNPR